MKERYLLMTKRLLVWASGLGSDVPREMRQIFSSALAALLLFLASTTILHGQEAVSTSGSSGSTSSSSSGPTGGPTTTSGTESSLGTSSAPGAVSNAPTAADSMQGGPGSAGVFSPTPIKLYLSLGAGYDDNVNT